MCKLIFAWNSFVDLIFFGFHVICKECKLQIVFLSFRRFLRMSRFIKIFMEQRKKSLFSFFLCVHIQSFNIQAKWKKKSIISRILLLVVTERDYRFKDQK